MFKLISQNIGVVKPKKTYEVYFEYEGELKIVTMKSPCDCSLIYDEKDKKRIRIVYIPKHISEENKLQGKHQITVQKNFEITYERPDGAQQKVTLFFVATVKDNS